MNALDEAPTCKHCGDSKTYCMEKGIYECEPCRSRVSRVPQVQAELDLVDGSHSQPRSGVEVSLEVLEKSLAEQKKQSLRVTIFDCKSCGAQVETPVGEPFSQCMFCGRKTELQEVDAQTHEHQVFIPFRVGLDEAVVEMQKHLDKLWLRPAGLRSKITAQSIRKIYLPFWCYDMTAKTRWSGTVRAWDEPGFGRLLGRKGRYRSVSVSGGGRRKYNDWLVCASKGMDSELVRQVEPFDTEGAALRKLHEDLEGVAVEIATTSPRLAWKRAKEEIRAKEYDESELESLIQSGNPAVSDVSIRGVVDFDKPEVKSAVLPFYIFTQATAYGNCLLVVNGETGAAGAQIPYSLLKTAPVALLAALVVLFATVLSGGLLVPAAAVYLLYRLWKKRRGVKEKAELFTEH